jgi:hypothetical protein
MIVRKTQQFKNINNARERIKKSLKKKYLNGIVKVDS